jgi:hypothetical protein
MNAATRPLDPFAGMSDDFDTAPTPVAQAARAKLHPFEQADLGRAPFACTHVTQVDKGVCAYCGTGIKYAYHIKAADGRAFVVGSDCVEKAQATVSNFGQVKARLDKQRRQAQTTARKTREAILAMEALQQWLRDNRELNAYLEANRRTDNFCASLLDWLGKHGSLTPGQQGAAERSMARDAQRKTERAQQVAAVAVAAPVVSVEPIEAAFAKAKAAGIKYPKLRLGDFTFSPASATSANAGAVYVKTRNTEEAEGAYMGKVMGGKFLRVRDCTDAQQAAVVAVCSDPEQAAIAFGKRFGRCAVCARELSDPESIERGIGPVCAENYGWG